LPILVAVLALLWVGHLVVRSHQRASARQSREHHAWMERQALRNAAEFDRKSAECLEKAASGEPYVPRRLTRRGGGPVIRSWAEEAASQARLAAASRKEAAEFSRLREP
jgi:hypothetical protein